MTLFEIVNFNKELIDRLVLAGFKLNARQYVQLYADYEDMIGRGEKVTYIVSVLADRYHISERKIYSIIKRFGRHCTIGAV